MNNRLNEADYKTLLYCLGQSIYVLEDSGDPYYNSTIKHQKELWDKLLAMDSDANRPMPAKKYNKKLSDQRKALRQLNRAIERKNHKIQELITPRINFKVKND